MKLYKVTWWSTTKNASGEMRNVPANELSEAVAEAWTRVGNDDGEVVIESEREEVIEYAQ